MNNQFTRPNQNVFSGTGRDRKFFVPPISAVHSWFDRRCNRSFYPIPRRSCRYFNRVPFGRYFMNGSKVLCSIRVSPNHWRINSPSSSFGFSTANWTRNEVYARPRPLEDAKLIWNRIESITSSFWWPSPRSNELHFLQLILESFAKELFDDHHEQQWLHTFRRSLDLVRDLQQVFPTFVVIVKNVRD